MEAVLRMQNPHWESSAEEALEERTCWSDIQRKFELDEILVLQGIRRAGKSTLFQQLIRMLYNTYHPGAIFYLNVDDPHFIGVQDNPLMFYSVLEIAEKITGEKIEFLFLDEVQNVECWEKFVKSVYDSRRFKKICVTGSNSALLEGEYAKLLTGRYLKQKIFPLNFSEVLSAINIKNQLDFVRDRSTMLRELDKVLMYGSFPRVYLEREISTKRDLLKSYYHSIIEKDCIYNNEIRDVKAFYRVSHYLLSNPGASYSYSRLSKALDVSDITLREFIRILEGSYLLYEVNHFSFSLKKQIRMNKKCYIADNGMISANSFDFFDRKGPLLENLVYVELRKLGYEDIYYYSDEKECDFIVSHRSRHVAIQVTYEVNFKNKERELTGLNNAMQKCGCEKGFIITLNQHDNVDGVELIPVWTFFSFAFYQDYLPNDWVV